MAISSFMTGGGIGSFIAPSEKKRLLILDIAAVVVAAGQRVVTKGTVASGARAAAERVTRNEAERNIINQK